MAPEATHGTGLAAPLPDIIAPEVFRDLMAARTAPLRAMGAYLLSRDDPRGALTRPLVAELLSQASQIEELLDAYRARTNRTWYPFRCLVAAVKLFANVTYVLLHVLHALPAYRLLVIGGDFPGDTERALRFAVRVLTEAVRRVMEEARRQGIPDAPHWYGEANFVESLPPGRLPHDRGTRKVEDVGETVTCLATEFLNLASEAKLLHAPGKVGPDNYADCIPDPISEESLRHLQQRFHNLQSLYDTHVLDTETETLDPDLSVLRGHISVIYHLLDTGLAFAHHYERHLAGCPAAELNSGRQLVPLDDMLRTLMEYSIAYASHFLSCAQGLCQEMIRRYAQVGRIEVPAPRYRGFHVRPSTLVAKVVSHYGSNVTMILDGQQYDASSPFEIFRANEKINARKRNWLAEQIASQPCLHDPVHADGLAGLVHQVVLSMAEQGKLIIYEQPLPLDPDLKPNGGTTLQALTDEIARLQATGKIDIRIDLGVTFIGDARVLSDIRLLAECGYGEDNFGNNIPLPEALAYLRR